MKLLRASIAIVAVLTCSTAYAADRTNGERLAKRWCASCHVVAPGQKGAATEAPPFDAIARQPGFNEKQIAYFLLDPHPKMPDMNLSRTEAADLAAYIATFK
jgi:mono/diheme cytochrome c family protein